MRYGSVAVGALVALVLLAGCERSERPVVVDGTGGGATPADRGPEARAAAGQIALGPARVGDLDVTCAQGAGALTPGGTVRLWIGLPYEDGGATEVRGWLGGPDRGTGPIATGTYSPRHADYELLVTIPDPLTPASRWWIELLQPDGTRLVGSLVPVLDVDE